MGKQKTGIQVKKAPKPEKRIHKQPSFRKCLEREINRLRKHHRHLSTREFSIRLHNFIKMFQIRHQIGRDLTAEAVDCLRICKCCDSWLRKDRFVECYQCEDSYHMGCALGDLTDPEEWLCPSCQLLSDREVTRREILEQFGVSRKVTKVLHAQFSTATNATSRPTTPRQSAYAASAITTSTVFKVGQTNSSVSDATPKFRVPISGHSEEILDRSLAGHATLLEQFSATKKEQFFKQINAPEEEVQQSTVSISWANPICLRPPIRLDQQQIQKYRKSLLYALYSKQMQYTQKPIYKCPKPENVEQVDVTIDRINFKDLSAFEVYKKQPIGPYLIQAVEGMGYDVVTERSIPKGTIVCEYVGQVITRRQALSHLQNDSLMELLTGKDADVSLIIKPEEYSNIARFINGINNRNPESRRKANINSVRLNVLGEPKVVLYARRVIKPGESLMYDYNAALDKYPTEDFI